MQAELDHLLLEKESLDTQTILKIEDLKKEITSLEQQVDSGNDELGTLWLQKRKELRVLTESSGEKSGYLLQGDLYDFFIDKESFLENSDREVVKHLLRQRLDDIHKMQSQLSPFIDSAIKQLCQQQQAKNFNRPDDQAVKEQKAIVKKL